IFFGRDLMQRRKDGRHRAIYPDVDRAELPLDSGRRTLDRISIGDIGGQRQRLAPRLLHFGRRRVEPVDAARQQPDARAAAGEGPRGGATHAGGGSGDDDGLCGHRKAPNQGISRTERRDEASRPTRKVLLSLVHSAPGPTALSMWRRARSAWLPKSAARPWR